MTSAQKILFLPCYIESIDRDNMKRIFLIGYMGAGKSTLGKTLARKLNIAFIDLDRYIECRLHKTIPEIFSENGESTFRVLEKNLLHEVCDFENVVIAGGGGTPCFFDNIDYINTHTTCVYLQTSVDELFERLKKYRDSRPLLQNKNDEELHAFIEKNLSSRENFYKQAAIHFDTGRLATAQEITARTEQLAQIIFKK